MGKPCSIIVGTVYILLLLMVAPCLADEAASEAQLQQLRQHIEALQAEIESVSGQYDRQQNLLAEVERSIGELTRSLHEIDQSLVKSRQNLARLKTRQQTLSHALEQQREALALQLRTAYIMGHQQRLKLLFNQQDPGSLGRILTYYDYFNQERIKRHDSIQADLLQLRNTTAAISSEERAVETMRAAKQADRASYQQRQLQRQQVIDVLATRIRSGDAELTALQHDEQRLEKLLLGIRRAIEDVNAEIPGEQKFVSLKGRLPWPADGNLQAKFGTPRIGQLKWDGVMISADEGNEVRAVYRGRVAYADWFRGFGLLLIVDHGDGYMSLYGYNQSLYKETGDWVESSEVVASVGRSGGRNNAAVYFGIRKGGRAVNPKKWCRATKGLRVSNL